jgi:16S rRNA (uracil1498-N3)-methyltransferase
VNIVLVEPREVVGSSVTLGNDDRRAHHLRTTLRVTSGARVKVGVIGGQLGVAEVVDAGDALELRLELAGDPPAPLPIELVLAIPRPKVLSRTLEIAASFAIERIALTNAWRVDKSYLSSPRLEAGALARAARLGAEQGATTHVPPIAVHRRLMELVDARWPAPGSDLRLLAHPGGEAIENAVGPGHCLDSPVTLAIGPEGGWIEREVETFVARGFRVVSLGAPILRVEAAVAAALAQLILLRRLTDR